MKQKQLLLAFLASILPLSLWANGDTIFQEKTVEGIVVTYKVISEEHKTCQVGNDSQAILYGITGTLSIPDEVNGYTVTSIGNNAFSYCTELTSIIIPQSVTTIGSYAFYRCLGLTTVTILNGMTSIGYNAFRDCGLTSISFPNGFSSIGTYAFQSCNSLETVTLTGNATDSTVIGERAFYHCENLKSVTFENINIIGRSSFVGCEKLSKITFSTTQSPSSENPCDLKIGKYAFSGCKALENIGFSDNLTAIDDGAFNGCKSIKKLSFPKNLQYIGEDAFDYCEQLASIEFDNCSVDIGSTAFYDCSSLTDIKFPNQLKSIGARAFWNCKNLSSVTIPNCEMDMGIFEGCSNLKSVSFYDNGRPCSIGDYAFWYNINLKSVTFNENVTKIGNGSFERCEKLETVSFPKSIKTIGNYAFMDCFNLQSINFSEGLDSIGYWAFFECGIPSMGSANKVLRKIVLPKGLKYIGKEAFCDCPIQTIYIPEYVSYIGENAFGGNPDVENITVDENNQVYDSRGNCSAIIETATGRLLVGSYNSYIPEGVKSIDAYAFYNCQKLSSIVIPSSVTSIGESAFYYCNNLKTVTIPNSVTRIESRAFQYCMRLASITISNPATFIGHDAFNETPWFNNQPNGLIYIGTIAYKYKGEAPLNTQIIINDGVTGISDGAFFHCNGISSVIIPTSVTYIGKQAFEGCSDLTSVNIPSSVTKLLYQTFSGCSNLTSIVIPNSVDSIGDGVFSGCKGLFRIAIPNSVKSIGTGAFSDCSGLASVTIGNSVTSIGDWAFNSCSNLTSITIPNSVTSIGDCVFQDCIGLTSITIGNSVTSIGNSAFSGCSGLTSVTIGNSVTSIGNSAFNSCSGLTSVTIPNSVTSIGSSAFENCSGLTSVTIGNSVTSIGDWAFNSCSGLTSVTIPNSVTSIGSGAFYGCSSLTSITIPNSVKSIEAFAFKDCCGLTSVTSLIAAPFDIYPEVFCFYNSPILYVPAYALVDYQQTKGWKDFSTILPVAGSGIALQVKNDAGEDFTDDVKIIWYDETKKQIGMGNSIGGVEDGDILYYSVTLDKKLGSMFREVSYHKAVVDGKRVTCYLEKIPTVTLTAQVLATGTEAALADVTVTQRLNGKYEKTVQAKTDADGRFTIEVMDDVTELTVQYSGFMDYQLTRDRLGTGNLGTLYLEQVKGTVLTMNLSYQEAATQGEQPNVQNWYSDTRNIQYTLYNMKKGVVLTDFAMQQGDIVIPTGVDAGDRISVTAHSLKGDFADATEKVTVGADGTAEVNLLLKAYGGVDVHYSQKQDEQLLAMLYDVDGRLAASTTFSGYSTAFRQLQAGNYQLVTMGYNGGVGSVGNRSDLDALGLIEGTDYALSSVTVSDGMINQLYVSTVPELDASKFEYTSANTSYLPSRTQMTAGMLATMTARVAFLPQYAEHISNVRLVVTIPEGCTFIDNSVIVDNVSKPYTLNGRRLTIPLTLDEIDSHVRFCFLPTQGGTFSSTALAEFNCQGERTQTIGTAVFEATGEAIHVPSATREKTINVSGIAAPQSEVAIYDGGHLIGTTTAKMDGSWRTDCELYCAYNLSSHEIYAQYRSPYQQDTAKTASVDCLYDINCVVAKSVTMNYCDRNIVFDFVSNTCSNNFYSFVPSVPTFTFVADLTSNDTTSVSGVTFYVYTTQNNVRKIQGFFDEKLSRWVAVSKFDSYCLPVNVSVEVEVSDNGTDAKGDRQYIDDEMALVIQTFNEAKTEATEINNLLEVKEEPLDDEAIFEKLEALTQSENFDQAKANELLGLLLDNIPDNIGTTDNDTNLEQIAAETEQKWEEYKEWLRYVQGEGRKELLADLMIDTRIAAQDMPQGSFNAKKENEEGTYEYSIKKLASLDEQVLLADGYSVINMTDGSKLFVRITPDGYTYIDLGTLIEYSFIGTTCETEETRSNEPFRLSRLPSCSRTLKNLGNLLINQGRIMPQNDAELREHLNYYKQVIDLSSCVYEWARVLINNNFTNIVTRYNQAMLQLRLDEATVVLRRQVLNNMLHSGEAISARDYTAAVNELRQARIVYNTRTAYANSLSGVIAKLRPFVEALPRNCNGTIPTEFMRWLGKLGGGFGSVVDILNLWNSANVAFNDMRMMINDVEAAAQKMPCEGNEEEARRLYNDLLRDAGTMAIHNASIIGLDIIKTTTDLAALRDYEPETAATLWVTSLWVGVINDVNKFWENNRWERMRFNHQERLNALRCGEEEEEEGLPTGGAAPITIPKEQAPKPVTQNITPAIDPSGFVYEAVPTNRIKGVTATVYEQETGTTPWDAEEYSQVNPQVTDETGLYRWDVPMGNWQVRFVKEGYETTQTDWLPVPPPQLEINIPMTQGIAPEVIKAHGTESGITLTFSKYMRPQTVEQNGRLSAVIDSPSPLRTEANAAKSGDAIKGRMDMVNLEEDPYTGNSYASVVKYVPAERPLKAGDVVLLTVKKDVESYCGVMMEGDQTLRVVIEPEIKTVKCDSLIAVDYMETAELEITLLPVEASKGRKMTVESTSPMIALVEAPEIVFDDEGKARVVISGELPGEASIRLSMPDVDLNINTQVSVVLPEKKVKTPKASKPTGSEVEKGYLLSLTSSTAGATIYYTLDGTDPTDEQQRIKYTGPIAIQQNITIKAVAVRNNMHDSNVATFKYFLDKKAMGDVDKNGVVDVADMALTINHVLKRTLQQEDVWYRMDMNVDGKIDVGDVILIIRNILSQDGTVVVPAEARGHAETVDLTQYTAMQLNVVVPTGTKVSDIRLTGANGRTHQLMYQQTGDGCYTVVVFSLDNALFSSDEDSMLDVILDGNGDVETVDVLLTTPTGERTLIDSLPKNVVTGIKMIDANGMATGDVYDLRGNKVLAEGASLRRLPKGVYVINGRKVIK